MRTTSVYVASALLVAALACSESSDPLASSPPDLGTAPATAAEVAPSASSAAVVAVGAYHFVIPADFNGGIFGVEIGNHVSFVARRTADGRVAGRYR